MSFINWGQETPAQLEVRRKAEMEWQMLVEQAINRQRKSSRSTSTQAGAVGGGSKGDNTINSYVESGYVEDYFV